MGFRNLWLVEELKSLQNHCLRVIYMADKATCMLNLEVEVAVPLLGIHLDSLLAQFWWRLEDSNAQEATKDVGERVREMQGPCTSRKSPWANASGIVCHDWEGRATPTWLALALI
jgi:hypothetical protein